MTISLSPTSSRFSRLAIEESILGYKTSTTFLSSLGSNLRLEVATPQPSPTSTPVLASHDGALGSLSMPELETRGADASLGAPLLVGTHSLVSQGRFLALSLMQSPRHRRRRSSPSAPLQPMQREAYEVFTVKDVKSQIIALQMIAISVRSQWLLAVWSLCTHPLNACGFFAILYLASRYVPWIDSQESLSRGYPAFIWPQRWSWTLSLWLVVTGIIVGSLVLVVWSRYGPIANDIDMSWLDRDEVLAISKFRGSLRDDQMPVEAEIGGLDKLAGALILSWESREAQVSKCRRKRVGRGFIRAWAVQAPEQNRGVGTALLREAARTVAARGGEGLWFAEDHAHSASVLPSIYHGPFDRRDRHADHALNHVLEEQSGISRRY